MGRKPKAKQEQNFDSLANELERLKTLLAWEYPDGIVRNWTNADNFARSDMAYVLHTYHLSPKQLTDMLGLEIMDGRTKGAKKLTDIKLNQNDKRVKNLQTKLINLFPDKVVLNWYSIPDIQAEVIAIAKDMHCASSQVITSLGFILENRYYKQQLSVAHYAKQLHNLEVDDSNILHLEEINPRLYSSMTRYARSKHVTYEELCKQCFASEIFNTKHSNNFANTSRYKKLISFKLPNTQKNIEQYIIEVQAFLKDFYGSHYYYKLKKHFPELLEILTQISSLYCCPNTKTFIAESMGFVQLPKQKLLDVRALSISLGQNIENNEFNSDKHPFLSHQLSLLKEQLMYQNINISEEDVLKRFYPNCSIKTRNPENYPSNFNMFFKVTKLVSEGNPVDERHLGSELFKLLVITASSEGKSVQEWINAYVVPYVAGKSQVNIAPQLFGSKDKKEFFKHIKPKQIYMLSQLGFGAHQISVLTGQDYISVLHDIKNFNSSGASYNFPQSDTETLVDILPQRYDYMDCQLHQYAKDMVAGTKLLFPTRDLIDENPLCSKKINNALGLAGIDSNKFYDYVYKDQNNNQKGSN